MGEPIWCNVKVAWPAKWPNPDDHPFANELGGTLIGWMDYDDGVLNVSGEGNYGLYDSCLEPLLDQLMTHGVPYIATSDAKYEYTGEYRYFDGEGLLDAESSESGVVMGQRQFEAIKEGGIEAVEQWFAKRPHDLVYDPDELADECPLGAEAEDEAEVA